jgi:glycosyltransferase involved in cell wall biosynthesis
MRALLVANRCSPYQGSEWKVGWGRVLETAKHFDTWVITSELSRADIEHYLRFHGPLPALHFHFLGPDRIQAALEWLPSLGNYNWPAYKQWHRNALRLASQLHRHVRFHIVHQVNLCGFREPGYLWKLDAPFIWGPIGGTQLYPWRFLTSAGFRGCLAEGLRNLLTVIQLRLSPRVRQAARKAAAVLTANSQGLIDMKRLHAITPVLLLETGLHTIVSSPRASDPSQPLRILWSGDLLPHKAFHLLLHALAEVSPDVPYELRVVGRGRLSDSAKDLAERLGVAPNCQWMGWLPHEEALQHYAWADVFVFTSLRDTSGNVVLESLSYGVPVVCLDHQGAADMITVESGIKVPVSTPPQVVAGLRQAIETLGRDRQALMSLSKGALDRARNFLWSRNGEEMARVYASVLSVSIGKPDLNEIPNSAIR